MKVLGTIVVAAVAVSLSGPALAAEQAGGGGQGRIGIGMNLGSAEATYSIDAASAVGARIDLDLKSGDFDTTTLGFDAWYQMDIMSADPVKFFGLAGLGYGSTKEAVSTGSGNVVTTDSGIRLFGGVGTEYFVPGTKSLSIEAKVGLMVEFLSTKTVTPFRTTKSSGTEISIQDLTGGLFVIRYYIN
jgi:hypothetical protein